MTSESSNDYGAVHPTDPSSIGRGPGLIRPDRMVNFSPADPGAEVDPGAEMMEAAMYANFAMSEERGRMDPELGRMMNAESARDIAPILESFRRSLDTDLSEAVDKYGNTRALSVALKRSFIMEKPLVYLTHPDHLIVVKRNDRTKPGTILEDGRMGDDSMTRVDGYSMYVDTKMVDVPDIIEITNYDLNGNPIGRTEQKRYHQIRKEEVNFGTDKKREELKGAYFEFVKQGIVVEKVFNHANLLWNMRAALEGMVKTIYTKEIIKSNVDISNFFKAPEISEMGNNPENKKVGEQRDKATRLFEFVGHCETKEKLEEHLNSTFNMESILDYKTQNRVLGIMKESGKLSDVEFDKLKSEPESFTGAEVSERYKKVIEFLIGKNIAITKDSRGILQYRLGNGWLTGDQRDPTKTDDEDEKKKRGKRAIGQERAVRGWLTDIGNPYVRDRDDLTAITNKIGLIVGSSQSTIEAFRNFYWWGEPDWLGAEIYSKDSLPDGDTLAKKRSELRGQEWLDYAAEIASYFTTGGEPNGTDLIKVMWPNLYRLKDMIAGQGRPTGQYVTIGEMEHLAQSFFGLVRSKVEVNGKSRMRNVREQWLGSKDAVLGKEDPHNLGDIEWMKVGGPTEVLNELLSERIGSIDWKEVELVGESKKIVESYKTGDKAALIKAVEGLVSAKTEGIGAGAEGFYWLMNFLVADDNEVKRMWAALNSDLKPDTLMVTSGFTGKIKFMDITQVAQGVYDGYIQAEKRAIANKETLDDQVLNEGKKRAKDYVRIWYKGVKGSDSYATWSAKPIELENPSGGEPIKINMGEYVDNLATMYDFMDEKDKLKLINRLPRLVVVK